MIIGVISDSHKRDDVAKEAMLYLKDRGASIIIHAGDIVEKTTLKDLKELGIPYRAVLGNNDHHLEKLKEKFNLYSEPYEFSFGSFSFLLMHKPKWLKSGTDFCIFGHTHTFECFKKDKTIFVNPGEICARNKPLHEFCYIDTDSMDVIKVSAKAKKQRVWIEEKMDILELKSE